MPIALFWLTPVFLLIVVIVLILQEQQHEKTKIVVIDPLTVIESIEIARILGEETLIRQELAAVRSIAAETNSSIAQVLRLLALYHPVPRRIEPLSERVISETLVRYQYRLAGRVISLLVGTPQAVNEFIGGPSSSEDRMKATIGRAESEGYLTVAVAHRIDAKLIDGQKPYKFLGVVIGEPLLNDRRVHTVRQYLAAQKVRAVSVFSPNFVRLLLQKIVPITDCITASAAATRSLAPSERSALFDRITVYGDALQNDRYEALLHWQQRYQLSVVVTDEDRAHLPGEHVRL